MEQSLKRITVLLLLITIGLGSFFIMGSKEVEHTNPVDYSYDPVRSPFDNKIYPVKIPDTLLFAGEPVPLKDPDVKQRLDRELLINSYWHSQTLYILKEYNQVVSMIKPILEKNGVPDDFIYLCIAESGLQINVVSPSGAAGLWQFMEATGKNYGLEINGEVDERYSYEKSTDAACRYLIDAKEKLGSWTLAAASYNTGMGSMQSVLQKQQADNYYDLYLNREASRYVYRIVALKQVLEHPQQYGFFLSNDDDYAPYKYYTVNVDTPINDFTDFAKKYGATYKVLKLLNPWIMGYTLSNSSHKTYELKLPYTY